ncbi:hypothetical protein BAN20980_00578 [Burkholderia anthina]|uniref:Uncharacterized protein n=1 Tax=Burkholderia anthina TaxID=179879 RepID=A0A6P2G4F2_9BURK|nr:hypothetical protein BAN20980_00578 [Burkholderia anthina]
MRLLHGKRLIFAPIMRKTHVTRPGNRNRPSYKAPAVIGTAGGGGTGGGIPRLIRVCRGAGAGRAAPVSQATRRSSLQ